MYIGIEFGILVAIRCDGIARDRGADRVGTVKSQRLAESKMLAQCFGDRTLTPPGPEEQRMYFAAWKE